MTKELQTFVIAKTNDLLQAPSASADVKAAAETWLAAVGTDEESAANAAYVAALEANIMPIDGLIAFAESAQGAQVFGTPEAAKGVASHARDIKAQGAKYCDCAACSACEAILEKKEELVG